jgi:hypothetical protein
MLIQNKSINQREHVLIYRSNLDCNTLNIIPLFNRQLIALLHDKKGIRQNEYTSHDVRCDTNKPFDARNIASPHSNTFQTIPLSKSQLSKIYSFNPHSDIVRLAIVKSIFNKFTVI